MSSEPHWWVMIRGLLQFGDGVAAGIILTTWYIGSHPEHVEYIYVPAIVFLGLRALHDIYGLAARYFGR